MTGQGRRSEAGSGSRVPATELERIVDAISTVTTSEDLKSEAQLDMQSLHRAKTRLVTDRTH